MNSRVIAHLALLGANLIYGINYSIAKDVMPDYIQPLGFILLRVSGAVLLFWLSYRIFFYERVNKRDLLKLAVCGLFGVAINQMLFFEGLNLTTPINAAVIMVTIPILVLLFGTIFSTEKITTRKFIGILAGASGAISLITYEGAIEMNSDHFWGNILVLCNATSYGIYLVLVKPLMKKYKPITIITWVFIFGFVYVIPFGWREFHLIEWNKMPTAILMETAFVVLCTTYLAYLLNIFGLKSLNPSVVSTYIYLQPVLASVVALMLGSDQLSFIKIAATLIIFVGVYLVSVPGNKWRLKQSAS